MTDPSLSCNSLSKKFGQVQALGEVTINESGPGVLGLIGPNGAGKTTLFDCITGRMTPDSGTSLVNGSAVAGLSHGQIARLGVTRGFQDISLFEGVTIHENLRIAAGDHVNETFIRTLLWGSRMSAQETKRLKQALEVLETVDLKGATDRMPYQLSFGQRRLVALAATFARESPIMLLDEPTAGLHPDRIDTVVELIKGLVTRGRLVLLIEHNMDVVRELADQILLIDAGQVVAYGSPNEVFCNTELVQTYGLK